MFAKEAAAALPDDAWKTKEVTVSMNLLAAQMIHSTMVQVAQKLMIDIIHEVSGSDGINEDIVKAVRCAEAVKDFLHDLESAMKDHIANHASNQ